MESSYLDSILNPADLGILFSPVINTPGGTVSLRFVVSIHAPSIVMMAARITELIHNSCTIVHLELSSLHLFSFTFTITSSPNFISFLNRHSSLKMMGPTWNCCIAAGVIRFSFINAIRQYAPIS